MAVNKQFVQRHTSGKTVYFRFYDPAANKFFDWDDNTWKAYAEVTTIKVAATEITAGGDANESLYTATVDISLMQSATTRGIVVQAIDDLATDELISSASFTLSDEGDADAVSDATTKLDAVNEILAEVGEYPAAALDTGGTSIVALAEACLDRVDKRIQEEGWAENTFLASVKTPDGSDQIPVASTIFRMDISSETDHEDYRVRIKGGFLEWWDTDNYAWEDAWAVSPTVDYVQRLAFSDLGLQLRNLIIAEAKVEFYRQQIGSDKKYRLLQEAAFLARNKAKRTDSEQNDWNCLTDTHSYRVLGVRGVQQLGR